MAKKGEKGQRDLAEVRAAKGKKGKRDLTQDRWKVQATILLPVDGDLQPKDLQKQVEQAGGTFSVRTRTVVRGYQPEDSEASEDGGTTSEGETSEATA